MGAEQELEWMMSAGRPLVEVLRVAAWLLENRSETGAVPAQTETVRPPKGAS